MLTNLILTIRQVIYILVIIKILLSYLVDPFNPFRQTVDRVMDPLLRPIQQIVPTFGRFDFSPVILILIVDILSRILLSII